MTKFGFVGSWPNQLLCPPKKTLKVKELIQPMEFFGVMVQ
jgi:hypothetical protein